MKIRGQQRDGESADEYRARGYRGYRTAGLGLMALALIMWVIAAVRPGYRATTLVAGAVWFALGLAFVKLSSMSQDEGPDTPTGTTTT